MWALLIAFVTVGGLVKFAYGQLEEPTVKPALRKAKLVRLARMDEDKLSLNQAEDGQVLAREFDVPELGKRFLRRSLKLKAKGKR